MTVYVARILGLARFVVRGTEACKAAPVTFFLSQISWCRPADLHAGEANTRTRNAYIMY
jgi:hypothetical protein